MDQDFARALLRVIIFLPLILTLAYLTVRFGMGRVTGTTSGDRQLEVIERLPLSSKAGLAVVRCGERYFLIGLGDGSPALLTELPDYPVMAAATREFKVCSLQSLAEREREIIATGRFNPVVGWLQAGWKKLKNHDK